MFELTKYFKAKIIIVWDEGQHKTLENGYLGIKDGLVEGFFTQLPEGVPYEDLGDVAICPGFINLHCHPTEVYGCKSYIEDIGNPHFYESTLYDYALVIAMGERGAKVQAKLNMAEMLKSGCTTILTSDGPYSRFEADLAGEMGMRAYIGAGIRAGDAKEEKSIWHSPNGHSLNYSFDEKSGKKRLEEAAQFVKEYDGEYDGRIKILLGPTQTMTCTPSMLKDTRKMADRLGVGITIHGAESLIEFESCVRMYGKTPVQLMADTGMLASDVIIAHCLFIQGHSDVNMVGDKDFELLGESGATVAHCPWTLARSGETLQSFSRYLNAGINVGIGTDTFPSDFIQEMRHVASMGKMVERSTFGVNAKQVFYAATVNGAKAFGREDIGRLSPGTKADFVVFKLDSIEMSPTRDFVKNLVYSATRHSVERVYVEGKCLLRDGQIEGFDESSLSKELQELAEYAWAKVQQYDRDSRTVNQLSPLSCPRYLED